MPHMFIPGPVDVEPEILDAQAQPMLPHRSAEFEAIFQRASDKARQLFFTQDRVFLTASSGTGLQEAAIRNLAHERVLSCVNGAFGSRWHDVALSNGKAADRLDIPWDQPITPERAADALRKSQYELFTIVHNETSTGVQNPVAEISTAVRKVSPNTLIAVDAVSSLGGARIEMDAWGLDMVLTSSQKCLALPPGLGLAAVSDRGMAYAQSVPDRGWYFDLLRMERHRLKDSTPATPAISLIYALDAQLDHILAEGREERFARHAAIAERVQSWVLERGLGLYAPEGYRSKTVTTVVNNLEFDITALNEFLLSRGMRIANGYGPLKGKTFRIAHMGETQLGDIERLLAAMDDYMGVL
ncbi:MAG: alanine--glyoxylate aminotransferase family protein [Anaerolineales bacterium]|nr:alanine--glyoxylate aminotransferase family protein [Anaerolineales bacterium]